MARNSVHIPASTRAVWSVLEDPFAYPRWIVGADETLAAEPAWPAAGSRFRVRLAIGLEDYTKVRAVARGERIVLDAAAGLFGPARVTITLRPESAGTRLTMVEDPAGKLTPLRAAPAVHLLLRLRNAESLRRLRRLVVARA